MLLAARAFDRFRSARLLIGPPRSQPPKTLRTFASVSDNRVNIVEVGARDGLQNEKGVIPVDVKVELINRLARTGLSYLETGSFVSPKWVPQMAGTAEVISRIERLPDTYYAVLVPNQKGLDDIFAVLDAYEPSPTQPLPPANEIAVFTAATDAFSLANTNTTVAESIKRLAPVVRAARERNLRVRGYVSVVITCPYSGKVDPAKVRDVTEKLLDMGCYEVSLGDTVGTGTPTTIGAMIEEVEKSAPVSRLAAHFHDTYGMAVANVMTALRYGIRTVDSSVGGLGGCPFSPGATGNVATEDILYALRGSQYDVGYINFDEMVNIGWWISEKLARDNTSRTGKAIRAKRMRQTPEAPRSKL